MSMVPFAPLNTSLAVMTLSLTQLSKTMPSSCFFFQHFVCLRGWRFKILQAVSSYDKVCMHAHKIRSVFSNHEELLICFYLNLFNLITKAELRRQFFFFFFPLLCSLLKAVSNYPILKLFIYIYIYIWKHRYISCSMRSKMFLIA